MKWYRRQWLAAVLWSTFVAAGCDAASSNGTAKAVGVPMEMAPRPTDPETGGKKTEFYFEYVLEGGDLGGAVHQVLVITTNENIDLPIAPTFEDDNFKNWGELYVVSAPLAEKIEAALDEQGFFDSKSIPASREGQHKWNATSTDGYQWTLTAKTLRRRHRVIHCFVHPFTESTDGMEQGAPGRPNSAALARKGREWVAAIRDLAASEGKLVEKSSP